MEIRSKAEFFRLWEAGVLGNRLRIWRDPVEAIGSGVPLVGFRQIGVAGGGRFTIAPRKKILAVANEWCSLGLRFVVCEAAPDDRAVLQGEIRRDVGGWEGYLQVGGPGLPRMRDSLARGLMMPVRGMQVIDLLNRYMDASSRDDLEGLLDLYPEASVEFTTYECLVGRFPGRNTIFWECRNY